MRSPLEVSTMGVMFSVQGDSVRPLLPPRAFSVEFEEEIVPGVNQSIKYILKLIIHISEKYCI